MPYRPFSLRKSRLHRTTAQSGRAEKGDGQEMKGGGYQQEMNKGSRQPEQEMNRGGGHRKGHQDKKGKNRDNRNNYKGSGGNNANSGGGGAASGVPAGATGGGAPAPPAPTASGQTSNLEKLSQVVNYAQVSRALMPPSPSSSAPIFYLLRRGSFAGQDQEVVVVAV